MATKPQEYDKESKTGRLTQAGLRDKIGEIGEHQRENAERVLSARARELSVLELELSVRERELHARARDLSAREREGEVKAQATDKPPKP